VFIGGGTVTGYGLAIPTFGVKYCFSMKEMGAKMLGMAGNLVMKGLKYLICPNKADAEGANADKDPAGAKAQGSMMKWLCDDKKGIVAGKDDKGAVAQGLQNVATGLNTEIADGTTKAKEDATLAKATDSAGAKKALVDGPLKACMAKKNCLSVFKGFMYEMFDAQIVFQLRTSGSEINLNFPIEGGNMLKGLIEVVSDTAGVAAVADVTKQFFLNLVAKIRAVMVGIIKDMFDIFSKLGDFAEAKAKELAQDAKQIGKEGVALLGKGVDAAKEATEKALKKLNPFSFNAKEVKLMKQLRQQIRKH